MLGNVGKLRYTLSVKPCGAKWRNKRRPRCVGENIVRGTVERTRTREREERVKASRAAERVRWPGGEEKRKSRETEKQTWRRWGIDEAESWVIPAVNPCALAACVCLCECEYEW